MTTIASIVSAAGGLLHKRDLVQAGARDRHLTQAVRKREVRRPRRGWYSTWPPDDPRFIAVQVGGRLTGLAALLALVPWRWDSRRPPQIVVSVPRNAARLRHRPGVRVVYDPPEIHRRGSAWQVDVVDAFARALLEAPFEEAVALIDWAMRTFAVTRAQLHTAIERLPANARRVLAWADMRCDSFPESIARTRLRLRGHAVRSQGRLQNGQFIDLVVDRKIGLEIDGRKHHAERFEEDRQKDLRILQAGLVPVRVTVTMLRDSWAAVESALETVVPRRRPMRPRPSLAASSGSETGSETGSRAGTGSGTGSGTGTGSSSRSNARAPRRRRTWWLH